MPRESSALLELVVRSAGFGVAAIIQAITLVIVARDSGPLEFGVFSQLFAAGIVLGIVTSFGHPTRVLRASAEPDAFGFAFTALVLRLATAIIVAAAILVMSWAITREISPAAIAAAASVLAELSSQMIQAVLSGRSRIAAAALVVIAHRVVVLVATVSLPIDPLLAYAVGCLLVGIGVVGLSAKLVAPLSLRRALSGNGGYWLATLTPSLGQLDVVVVGAVAGSGLAGLYASAARVVGPLGIVASAMINVFVPRIASARSIIAQRAEFGRIRRLSWLVAALITVASPVIAILAAWVLGPAYSGVEPIVAAFCIAVAISGVSRAYQSLLIAEGRPAQAAVATAVGAGVGLLSLAAVPFVGVAWVWMPPIVAQAVVLTCSLAFVQRSDRR